MITEKYTHTHFKGKSRKKELIFIVAITVGSHYFYSKKLKY